jgi:hypothetical protein
MSVRRLLTDAACAALGSLAAFALAHWRPLVPAPQQVRAPVRVVFHAAPVPTTPTADMPVLQPQAPRPRTVKSRDTAVQTQPAPSAARIKPMPTQPEDAPAQAEPPQSGVDDSPPRPQQVPVLPIPEGVVPGGNAVVLALRINHTGRAEDMAILVHSKDPFFDLAVALQAMQTTFDALNPPLAPGEARWIALTFYKQESSAVLP